jgi:hypothetical protein
MDHPAAGTRPRAGDPDLVAVVLIIVWMCVSELIRYGAPPALAKVWTDEVTGLTEIQAAAVEAGMFDGRTNLLVVGPTSSGKTLVGEMAAATSSYRTRRNGNLPCSVPRARR